MDEQPFPLPWTQVAWDIRAANGKTIATFDYNWYPDECRQQLIDEIISAVTDKREYYGHGRWHADDVLCVFDCTVDEANAFLEEHVRYIDDVLIERGNDMLLQMGVDAGLKLKEEE